MRTIWLDMDGTIADLYGVENWLPMLEAYDPTPYAIAKPLVRMATLARLLNNRQKDGYKIGIVSALSKNSTPDYDAAVIKAKTEWLKKHLPSVNFDEICFIPYFGCKNDVNSGGDFLFDDEERHLKIWNGNAFPASSLFKILRALR
jgi:5'(3')-deoxyribonucleotidase